MNFMMCEHIHTHIDANIVLVSCIEYQTLYVYSVRDFGEKFNFIITAEIRVDWDMKTLGIPMLYC